MKPSSSITLACDRMKANTQTFQKDKKLMLLCNYVSKSWLTKLDLIDQLYKLDLVHSELAYISWFYRNIYIVILPHMYHD